MSFSVTDIDTKSTFDSRPIRPLPPQLAEHCTACFEETIFAPALSFLHEALVSGLDVNAPACVPSSQHLALIATITVHPLLTTRTHNKDHHAGADTAFKYLRELVRTVEVEGSGLRLALRFESNNNRKNGARQDRHKRARAQQSEEARESDDEQTLGSIRSKYAGRQSLWNNAGDFWAVVGWAFTCSVRHKSRWERWKVWLEFMLDAIDSDLEATYLAGGDLSQSLIAQYLSHLGGSRGDKRYVMRAITVDGTSATFSEVWKDETKPPKPSDDEARLWKRTRLDLENGEYGDYLMGSDESSSHDGKTSYVKSLRTSSTRAKRNQVSSDAELFSQEDDQDMEVKDEIDSKVTAIDKFGGMDSMRLRQRLLALLTRFSRIVTMLEKAEILFMNTEDLFDLFTEFLRPLPLPIFQEFVLPMEPYLTVDLQVSLTQNLCCLLLGSNTLVDEMTQSHFETLFAPRCALGSSVIDNAKVSLLIESLLRALWKAQLLLGDTLNLQKQVEKGIEARSQRISLGGKKRSSLKASDQQAALISLRSSAERMQALLSVVSG